MYTPKEKFNIPNHTIAFLNEKDKPQRKVIICNVKTDDYHTTFNLKDFNTNAILRKNGRPIIWVAESAIPNKIITLPFKETNNNPVIIPPTSEEQQRLETFFLRQVRYQNKPFELDPQQLNAVLSNKNTLITARAGSGKTRVLTAKLIDLFENHNVKEDEVIAFCFNKDACQEINKRLNEECYIKGEKKYKDYNVAKTFHSFAFACAQPKGEILLDRKPFIKRIINSLKASPSFALRVYEFFKNEEQRINKQNFKNKETYYKYIRNCYYTTLQGENVKSRGEKIIADYLFEHGINYLYEPKFFPERISFRNSSLSPADVMMYQKLINHKKETVPDFVLPDYGLVWEHWGVKGNESSQQQQEFSKAVCDYKDYIKNKLWKRLFWGKDWRLQLADNDKYTSNIKKIRSLIETENQDFENKTRDEIENSIQQKLAGFGIINPRLPEQKLIDKVWENAIDGFTALIDQFINKYQQTFINNHSLYCKQVKEITDKKEKTFHELANEVYCIYTEQLNDNRKKIAEGNFGLFTLDFNQLLNQAIKIIQRGEIDDIIKKLKWILIDEYQDFSNLFNQLIESILSRNPNIKLFCVGDDWQAINRFAGSDLKYFLSFEFKHKDAQHFNIQTNYRSDSQIVRFANLFMREQKIPGQPATSNSIGAGTVLEKNISNIYLGPFSEDNIYLKYFDFNETSLITKAQYIKACVDIIKQHPKRKIMILSRTNHIYGAKLEEFETILRKVCCEFIKYDDFRQNVVVKNVHKSKGEEADVVIIINVNEKSFPSYNSNSCLFKVFNDCEEELANDEARLYYVALTRAKKSLYILYEYEKKSQYIFSKEES